MPSNGGNAEAITKGLVEYVSRFSPDGENIIYFDRSGSDDLWVQEIKTGEMQNISKMDNPVHQGTWSTSGKHVFGTELNMKVRHPVYLFNMYGKNKKSSLRIKAPVTHFAMHPSNGLVYFAHGDAPLYRSGDRIKTYNMENGEIKIYIDRPGGAANPLFQETVNF